MINRIISNALIVFVFITIICMSTLVTTTRADNAMIKSVNHDNIFFPGQTIQVQLPPEATDAEYTFLTDLSSYYEVNDYSIALTPSSDRVVSIPTAPFQALIDLSSGVPHPTLPILVKPHKFTINSATTQSGWSFSIYFTSNCEYLSNIAPKAVTCQGHSECYPDDDIDTTASGYCKCTTSFFNSKPILSSNIDCSVPFNDENEPFNDFSLSIGSNQQYLSQQETIILGGAQTITLIIHPTSSLHRYLIDNPTTSLSTKIETHQPNLIIPPIITPQEPVGPRVADVMIIYQFSFSDYDPIIPTHRTLSILLKDEEDHIIAEFVFLPIRSYNNCLYFQTLSSPIDCGADDDATRCVVNNNQCTSVNFQSTQCAPQDELFGTSVAISETIVDNKQTFLISTLITVSSDNVRIYITPNHHSTDHLHVTPIKPDTISITEETTFSITLSTGIHGPIIFTIVFTNGVNAGCEYNLQFDAHDDQKFPQTKKPTEPTDLTLALLPGAFSSRLYSPKTISLAPSHSIILRNSDNGAITRLFPRSGGLDNTIFNFELTFDPTLLHGKTFTYQYHLLTSSAPYIAYPFTKTISFDTLCSGQLSLLPSFSTKDQILMGDNANIQTLSSNVPIIIEKSGTFINSALVGFKWHSSAVMNTFASGVTSILSKGSISTFAGLLSERPELPSGSETPNLTMYWGQYDIDECNTSIPIELLTCPIAPSQQDIESNITIEHTSIRLKLTEGYRQFTTISAQITNIDTNTQTDHTPSSFITDDTDGEMALMVRMDDFLTGKYKIEVRVGLNDIQTCDNTIIIDNYSYQSPLVPIFDPNDDSKLLYRIEMAVFDGAHTKMFYLLNEPTPVSALPTIGIHQTNPIQITIHLGDNSSLQATLLTARLEYKQYPSSTQWITLETITIDVQTNPTGRFSFPSTFSTSEARLVITSTGAVTPTSFKTTSEIITPITSQRFIVHAACTSPTSPFTPLCGDGTCGPNGQCQCHENYTGYACEKTFDPVDDCNCIGANSIGCNAKKQCLCKTGFDGERCENDIRCTERSHDKCNYPNGLSTIVTNDNDDRDVGKIGECSSVCECNVTNPNTHWAGKDCRICTLQCHNNGRMYKQCDKCGCQAGFSGKHCECISKKVVFAIDGYNDLLYAYKLSLSSTETHPHYDSLVVGSKLIHSAITTYTLQHFNLDNSNDDQYPTITVNITDTTPNKDDTTTLSTRFEIVFRYGCSQSNPNFTTTQLTAQFDDLIENDVFIQSDVVKQYFKFSTNTSHDINIIVPISDAENTLPSPNDEYQGNNAQLYCFSPLIISILIFTLSFV